MIIMKELIINFINDINLDSSNINEILKDRDFLNIFTLNLRDEKILILKIA